MRLRRIAVGGVVLGLVGVVVRAEGRAVGRALLGRGEGARRRSVSALGASVGQQSPSESGAEVYV